MQFSEIYWMLIRRYVEDLSVLCAFSFSSQCVSLTKEYEKKEKKEKNRAM